MLKNISRTVHCSTSIHSLSEHCFSSFTLCILGMSVCFLPVMSQKMFYISKPQQIEALS